MSVVALDVIERRRAGSAPGKVDPGALGMRDLVFPQIHGRARLELSSPPTGGARVEVVLPFLTARAVASTVAPA